jgi:DNA-directed RNA polymerase sigma subunit (sigma70/sigma32)
MLQETGRKPSVREITRASDVPADDVRRLVRSCAAPLSLNQPVGRGEDADFVDLLSDESATSQSRQADSNALRGRIQDLLDDYLDAVTQI